MPPRSHSPARSALALLAFLLICFGAAATGALFPPGDWHAALEKPAWNPPNWLFGPVWTALYTMIAVSGWLAWRAGARLALVPYAIQLALNATWSWLFFGLHRTDLALVEILVLWLAILATLLAFRRIDKRAGLLLLPYLLWVSFAAVLNAELWRLNG